MLKSVTSSIYGVFLDGYRNQIRFCQHKQHSTGMAEANCTGSDTNLTLDK